MAMKCPYWRQGEAKTGLFGKRYFDLCNAGYKARFGNDEVDRGHYVTYCMYNDAKNKQNCMCFGVRFK